MSKGTIKYSQEFKSEFGNRWIGIDLVVNDDEDWDEKFAETERRVMSWAGYGSPPTLTDAKTVNWGKPIVVGETLETASNRVFYNPPSIPTIDPRAQETAEIGIDNATTIQDLESYADIAVKYGLVEMYLAKKKTLE